MLTIAEVAKQLNVLGLDCYVGFYHRNHTSNLALLYDMIEPFGHIVDRSVFEIQDSIAKKDYIFLREGIVVLSNDLKKRCIDNLTEILDRKRDYKANTGIRRADGYQRMEEITRMKMKCIELKHFILNTKFQRFKLERPHDIRGIWPAKQKGTILVQIDMY